MDDNEKDINDYGDCKLEATVFCGYESIPKSGEDSSGEDVCVPISMIVGISKMGGGDALEFACSAWPDCLEIEKGYLLTYLLVTVCCLGLTWIGT